MCPVILWLLTLTGYDVRSKIGTKYGALTTKPIDYLKTSERSKNLCQEEAENLGSYLVKVLRSSLACTTVNDFRIESYLDKSSSLIELQPTSSSLFGRILRSHFFIHQYLNLLNTTEKFSVQEFGWIKAEDGYFIQDKCLSPIPHYFIIEYGCKKRCSHCCQCSFADIKCTAFCACWTTCENA